MSKGRYGEYGGQYVPETLMNAVHEVEEAYEFVKIPVDQIIFIKKIAVKGLACDAADFHNLADGDIIDRSGLHAGFHCFGEPVFGRFGFGHVQFSLIVSMFFSI